MLWTPRVRWTGMVDGVASGVSPWAGNGTVWFWWSGQEKHGRLTRSDEHSPSLPVFGSESGHALQVRWRAEDSGFQTGQPLALQKIEARPVDGREVEPDGTRNEAQGEGGHEGCRKPVTKTQ